MRDDADTLMASRFEEMAASYGDERPDWDDVVARSSDAVNHRPHEAQRRRRAFLALTACAAAAVVALLAPWSTTTGPLNAEALAALGSGPVIHVVGQFQSGIESIDLATGAADPVINTQEVWYSRARGLLHTVTRSASGPVDDSLATPEGTFTPQGIVYDCAWIAAHPVQATHAHVSCNASGANGSTPHQIPRPTPTLDPTLAGFADGYQEMLSSGSARSDGSGQVDGRAVDWLAINTSNGRERVALDAQTHKPVILANESGWRMQITTIETTSFDPSDFDRPSSSEAPLQPSAAAATDTHAVAFAPRSISAAMEGAVWSGPAVSGIPLVRADAQRLEVTFANNAAPYQTGDGLELKYGTLAPTGALDRSKPYVVIDIAPTAALAAAHMWDMRLVPPAGQMFLATSQPSTAYGQNGAVITEPGVSHGQVETNGVDVTIQASSRALAVVTAQSLRAAG